MQDVSREDEVAIRRIPDFYLMVLNGVEEILRKKGPTDPIMVVFWLKEDGAIREMGFNRMIKLGAGSVGPVLAKILEDGVPGRAESPVDVAGAVIFDVDDEDHPGVIVTMRTRTLEADKFVPMDKASRTLSMAPMDVSEVRRVRYSSLMAH